MAVATRERSSHDCMLIPLQILLCINVVYYVVYFFTTLIMIIFKSQVYSYPDSNLALDLVLLFMMAILEFMRLLLDIYPGSRCSYQHNPIGFLWSGSDPTAVHHCNILALKGITSWDIGVLYVTVFCF
ncbi:transmembrane protein 80 isoform X2 [Ranitomeya imitator]|uniref:transmembrane protein 80 isoform X2 n=1 Tax=Ranitomeya imitator TaxID=111125 RepID=UPI0037E95A4C